jgi:hypothetical protein
MKHFVKSLAHNMVKQKTFREGRKHLLDIKAT